MSQQLNNIRLNFTDKLDTIADQCREGAIYTTHCLKNLEILKDIKYFRSNHASQGLGDPDFGSIFNH